MDYKEALNFVVAQPLDKIISHTGGAFEYSPAVDALIAASLDDFDMAVYDDYVKTAKFRPELLALKEGKKQPSEFSKSDLQLFLVIQQKAEDIMAGQIATIIENGVLIKVAKEIKK